MRETPCLFPGGFCARIKMIAGNTHCQIHLSKEGIRMKPLRSILWTLALCLALVLTACGRTDGAAQSPASLTSPAPGSALPAEPEQSPAGDPSAAQPEARNPRSESQADAPAAPAPEQAAASAEVSPKTAAAEANPFKLDPTGDYELYTFDTSKRTYSNLGCAGMSAYGENALLDNTVKAINDLPALHPGTPKENAGYEGGFMTVAMDGTYAKRQYFLRPNVLEVDGASYALTQEQYDALKKLSDTGNNAEGYGHGAHWLVYMNPKRVTKIECTDPSGDFREMKKENLSVAAAEPRYINMTGVSTYTPGTVDFGGMFKAVYTFDNNVTYTIAVSDSTVYLESSDMSYACRYTGHPKSVSSYMETTQGMIDGPANPRTGKPVIYLYPERTQDVSVKLDFRGRLSYTYPAYQDGWSVTAQPDGTLTNKADGSTHYYLFWEGEPEEDQWDFSTGFLVRSSEADAFLREKLPALGLTPREYNDFITYWGPELARNPYNLVTFAAEQYDTLAKLTVSPTPDTVLRVHMVFKAVDRPVRIKEQLLPAAPRRTGFTVVEWGGTRADK